MVCKIMYKVYRCNTYALIKRIIAYALSFDCAQANCVSEVTVLGPLTFLLTVNVILCKHILCFVIVS